MPFTFNQRQLPADGKTRLCGIVNVTPDSFSDGGQWYGIDAAYDHAMQLIEQGAEMIDIGGESTRPGSAYVPVEEEIERVIPVIERLKQATDTPLSIDTWKAPVAKAAIESRVDIINDITGFLGDEAMADVVAHSNAGAILMFNPIIARPTHPGSQIFPSFGTGWAFTQQELEMLATAPIEMVLTTYLHKAIDRALEAGIEPERLMLDPGIGFGLTKRENLLLIQRIHLLHDLGYPAFVGVSRKRFIVNLLASDNLPSDPDTEEGFLTRDLGSASLTAIVALQGAEVLRVHTIPPHRIARDMAVAVRNADQQSDQNFDAYH
ncbi:MAG: dihydropteroate synthase [Aerococcus sp.]|nr:dihydropteroate synthase [Aerococcus sp.]